MKLVLFFILHISICFGKIILIDPGHGGNDLGTKGNLNPKKTIYEKDLSLRLAKILQTELQKKYQVYLTRLDDSYVSLDARARMADTVKADLFISLHFNSNSDKSAQGLETYYLDNHNDVAVKKVEIIENVGLEGKATVINHILIDLSIKMTTKESKKLATFVHQQSINYIKKKFTVKNRAVKPGLLYVLALAKRPGILIEGGFMSSSVEMQKINSSDFLYLLSMGISKGIDAYFKK